jgi:hypothetical protein
VYRLEPDLQHSAPPLKHRTRASGRAKQHRHIRRPLQGTTNIEVGFHEPVTVRVINGHANVDTIRFYADAPTALLAAAHAQLADSPEGA